LDYYLVELQHAVAAAAIIQSAGDMICGGGYSIMDDNLWLVSQKDEIFWRMASIIELSDVLPDYFLWFLFWDHSWDTIFWIWSRASHAITSRHTVLQ
jgi:hypothetical protein